MVCFLQKINGVLSPGKRRFTKIKRRFITRKTAFFDLLTPGFLNQIIITHIIRNRILLPKIWINVLITPLYFIHSFFSLSEV